jgi:hypothetical protein
MKGLLALYFAIGVIFLSGQVIHHTYYSWFEREKSVLDRYKETKQTSMEEMEKRYEEAYKKVKALEKDGKDTADTNIGLYIKEPYKSEMKLRDAIEEKEMEANRKYRVGYVWLWGLSFLIAGFVGYRLIHELLGMPFMIAGFTAMIASTHDFNNYYGLDASIVAYKLNFALITLVLLIATAYLTGVFSREKDQESGQEMRPE